MSLSLLVNKIKIEQHIIKLIVTLLLIFITYIFVRKKGEFH